VHTALRRTRGTPHIDPYMALRTALLEIEKHNKTCEPLNKIKSVALHFRYLIISSHYHNVISVWTFHGFDVTELARRIHLSYKNFKNPFQSIDSDSFLSEQESILKPLPKKSDQEIEQEFLSFLTDGTIGTFPAKTNPNPNQLNADTSIIGNSIISYF
jgi:hypothetical protein